MIMHRGVRRESKMIDQVREVSLRFISSHKPNQEAGRVMACRSGIILKVYYTAQSFERLQKDSTILIR